MNDFTNDFHDVAQEEAFDLGFDALHGRAPDEVVMMQEEYVGDDDVDERVRCVISVLRAITWKVTSLEQIRDNVAILMGLKVAWYLVPMKDLWHGHKDREHLRQQFAEMAAERRLDWHEQTGEMLLQRFVCRGWQVEEVAKMVLLTLYAALPDQRFRPQMAASLGAIGKALGLKADNKRSAMSASMRANVLPLFEAVAVNSSGKRRELKLWFMKNKHCREALSVAMRGKRNRAKRKEGETLRRGASETGRHAEA